MFGADMFLVLLIGAGLGVGGTLGVQKLRKHLDKK